MWLQPPLLLRLNTLVVLASMAAFVGSAVPLLLFPSAISPYAFCGAVIGLPMLGCFAILLIRSVFGRRLQATQLATGVYFALAAFCLVGIAANTAEADLSRRVPLSFVAAFAAGGTAVVAYLVFCGWHSLQWARQLEQAASSGLCFRCGYDLRGLTEQRCPECGTPFEEHA